MSYERFMHAVNIIKSYNDIKLIQEALNTLIEQERYIDVNRYLSDIDFTRMIDRLTKFEGGSILAPQIPGITVLYSGSMGEIPAWCVAESLGDEYRVIGKTDLGKLFNIEDISQYCARNFPMASETMWDALSTEFIQYAEGNIKSITYGAEVGKVFRRTEFIEIITNTNLKITSFDEIDITELRKLAEGLDCRVFDDVGYDELWRLIRNASVDSTMDLTKPLASSPIFQDFLKENNKTFAQFEDEILKANATSRSATAEIFQNAAKRTGKTISTLSSPWLKMIPIVGFVWVYSGELKAAELHVKDGNYSSALSELLGPVATEVAEESLTLAIMTAAIAMAGSSTTPVMLGASASCPPLVMVLAAG